MKRTTKAFLIVLLILFIIAIAIIVLSELQTRKDIEESNVTEEITEEGPRYVIERPVMKDWHIILIVLVLGFLIVALAKPHWFRKLPLKKYKDIQDYWEEVYLRLLVKHRELLTGNSDKIIHPKHHFIKGNYYFVQVPNELLNFPESGGLPLVIIYNRDLGTIEGKLEFNMRSPITSERIRKYLIDRFVEKKEVSQPPEMIPSVMVTPIGTQYPEYT
jgi:hypothetical protein